MERAELLHRVDPPDPWIGSLLEGGIRLESLLGAGSLARVYRGVGPQGEVAVKVFETEPGHRFLDLVRLTAENPHPHLIRILGHGRTVGGRSFLVMEFLEGEPLEARVALGPVPLPEALDVALGIARGLEALHGMGWVHRDLKPHNVIVSPREGAKVLDLGLALRIGERGDAGAFEGSWNYVAPEQAMGEAASPEGDVYSLGVVLYEVVTGRVPFGDSPITAVLGHLHERPTPPRLLRPGLPPAIDAVILRSLEKEPSRRFPSMEAFAAALEACRAELPGEPAPGRRVPWSGIGLAAALLAGAAYFTC